MLGNNICVLPASLGGKAAKGTVLAARAKTSHTECGWNNELLDLVERSRHPVDSLDTLEGCRSPVDLVWQHATDGADQHVCWRAGEEGTPAVNDDELLKHFSWMDTPH